MPTHRWQSTFVIGLLLATLVLAFFIFRPYLGALVVAATFAVLFAPVYRFLLKKTGGRANLAAGLTTLVVLLAVILPLAGFGWQLWQESLRVYQSVSDPSTSLSEVLGNVSQEQFNGAFARFDIDHYTEQALRWLLQNTGRVFASVAKLGVSIFLSLVALFYLLRDGAAILRRLIALSPLRDSYDRLIAKRLHGAINTVIKGSLFIALIQGLFSGVGLAIFGVPNPVLWGSVAVIAALIPSVGTALVLVPAVAYLFLVNQVWESAGLLVWSLVVVGLVDNLLRPSLISRGIKIHPLLILLSVIGGLSLFGPLGFILGPLVLSLLFALLDIYEQIVAKKGSAS